MAHLNDSKEAWISTQDSLPGEDGPVLLFDLGNGVFWGDFHRAGSASWFRDQEEFKVKPTHWRAIPNAPVAKSAGPVICPHGELEVYCRECDLKARAALHDAVALAVMEERERCAKNADDLIAQTVDDGGLYCYGIKRGLAAVAQKIRSGE